MPEFKKGDRVRYSGGYADYSKQSAIGATGTVSGCDSGSGLTARVEWDRDGGTGDRSTPASVVYTANLEPVPPYVPQVGDKVRLVAEGKVTRRASDTEFTFDTGVDLWELEGSVDYTLELIEKAPEPFPVGTVVRHSDQVAFRTEAGWVWGNGDKSGFEDDFFRAPDVEILHEPPTS